MTSTCRNCGAPPNEPCGHDTGCVDADRHGPLPDELRPWPVGHVVEVEFPDGWKAGQVDGYQVDLVEDMVRIDVRLAPDRVARGCHPKHVRAAA
jgi:hypothetical protein